MDRVRADPAVDVHHGLALARDEVPDLHGYLRSRRGEFRLVDLGNGRTRVEGSTWYQIEMAPEAYWQIISDALIHRTHERVLQHIKSEVEGDQASAERR